MSNSPRLHLFARLITPAPSTAQQPCPMQPSSLISSLARIIRIIYTHAPSRTLEPKNFSGIAARDNYSLPLSTLAYTHIYKRTIYNVRIIQAECRHGGRNAAAAARKYSWCGRRAVYLRISGMRKLRKILPIPFPPLSILHSTVDSRAYRYSLSLSLSISILACKCTRAAGALCNLTIIRLRAFALTRARLCDS